MVLPPELDIVAYFPRPKVMKASAVGQLSNRLFEKAMSDSENPLFTARMKIFPPFLADRFGDSFWDVPQTTVLRSVLMKPEHLEYAGEIYARLKRHLDSVPREDRRN